MRAGISVGVHMVIASASHLQGCMSVVFNLIPMSICFERRQIATCGVGLCFARPNRPDHRLPVDMPMVQVCTLDYMGSVGVVAGRTTVYTDGTGVTLC